MLSRVSIGGYRQVFLLKSNWNRTQPLLPLCTYVCVIQEIPLSEILQVELAQDFSSLAQGGNPHCFEIITDNMVYYVGENTGTQHTSATLAASGVGLEVAYAWEKAIRQALMPVTPQPSVCSSHGQGKDHSE